MVAGGSLGPVLRWVRYSGLHSLLLPTLGVRGLMASSRNDELDIAPPFVITLSICESFCVENASRAIVCWHLCQSICASLDHPVKSAWLNRTELLR